MNSILMTGEDALARAQELLRPIEVLGTDAAIATVRKDIAIALINAEHEGADKAIAEYMRVLGEAQL